MTIPRSVTDPGTGRLETTFVGESFIKGMRRPGMKARIIDPATGRVLAGGGGMPPVEYVRSKLN